MLVAQAVFASERFVDTEYPVGRIDEVYREILAEKENIVLCGMPGCGKSTVGRIIAERLGKRFIDLDAEVVKSAGREITEIFAEGGESLFRELETEAVRRGAAERGAVIATGGGAVLKDENVRALRRNGRLYFLDRPLGQLLPTPDRPLALTKEAIEARYRERLPRYREVADVIIANGDTAEDAAERIASEFLGKRQNTKGCN